MFRALLEPGFSKPWPDALEALTGSRIMNATSLLVYFEPLMKWLEEANVDECLGWNCEAFAADYMANEYEKTTSYLYNQATIAEWNYETNLTDANGQNAVKNRVNLINRVRKSEIYLLSVDGMER
jgi:hypothetical protein